MTVWPLNHVRDGLLLLWKERKLGRRQRGLAIPSGEYHEVFTVREEVLVLAQGCVAIEDFVLGVAHIEAKGVDELLSARGNVVEGDGGLNGTHALFGEDHIFKGPCAVI